MSERDNYYYVFLLLRCIGLYRMMREIIIIIGVFFVEMYRVYRMMREIIIIIWFFLNV